MNQSFKDAQDVAIAYLGPHAALTYNPDSSDINVEANQLFNRHAHILGKIKFLQRFGTFTDFAKVAWDYRDILRRTMRITPERRNRVAISRQIRPIIRFLHPLAKNARKCESELLKEGLQYSQETRKCRLSLPGQAGCPKHFYTVLVEEAFEFYRLEHGTQNSAAMREAIACRLRPIFGEDETSTTPKLKLWRTIENYVYSIDSNGQNEFQNRESLKG